MQEKQYTVYAGKSIFMKMLTASGPEFMKSSYDSQGGEMKAAKQQ
jgi:hypothetical protein